MNKNIIIVGAIAAGLYLLSQGKKAVEAVAKKKATRRPPRKYPKPQFYPKTKRVIAKKKAVYNKPKIKKLLTRKKLIYHRPIPRKAILRKKPIYHRPISRKAILRKQLIKRMARRKRRR